MLFAFAFLGPSAGQENGLPNGTCFEDAIEEELRKNLTNMEGESVPVTFLLHPRHQQLGRDLRGILVEPTCKIPGEMDGNGRINENHQQNSNRY